MDIGTLDNLRIVLDPVGQTAAGGELRAGPFDRWAREGDDERDDEEQRPVEQV